jgi:hypothetical protein
MRIRSFVPTNPMGMFSPHIPHAPGVTRLNGPGGGPKGIRCHGVSNSQLTLPEVFIPACPIIRLPPCGLMLITT